MNLATWSLRNPILTVLLSALVRLLGIAGFYSLRVQNLPDLDLPTVNVALAEPGAAPSQLETQVARPVEDALAVEDFQSSGVQIHGSCAALALLPLLNNASAHAAASKCARHQQSGRAGPDDKHDGFASCHRLLSSCSRTSIRFICVRAA